MSTRRQATLYLPPPYDATVESIRARFNPAQHALIQAHVTLCREDEVADWEDLAGRLKSIGPLAVTLAFGPPVRDHDLVCLPAIGSTASFDALRESLLARPDIVVRKQAPHITLIHPRNGTCSDSAFVTIAREHVPFTVTFRRATLIAQVDGGPWRNLNV
ncbi:MAG: 2'-5' RNA ligase family protein [Gemmatimonadales bacterium]